ncbi:MAG: ATP-binding protein [Actinomycetota bacterium]|nr:ATP-binding protein [Actinomycetota bacterium]
MTGQSGRREAEMTTTTAARTDVPGGTQVSPDPTSTPPDTPTAASDERRWRSSNVFTRSARARILASYLILLAFSTLASVAAIRQILLVRLDDRIDEALVQEGAEFRRLAGGSDPLTGGPFGTNVRRIFDVYLARNVPSEGEALITLVDGRPYRISRTQRAGYALEADPRLLAEWRELDRSVSGSADTPAGPARYVAAPLKASDRTVGAFVVANFLEGEQDEVGEAVEIAGGVGIGVLVLASVLAYFAAGRVLAPLRGLGDTARAITESDLARRIAVEGDDEISELGHTFNRMLDRLEGTFSSQRDFIRDAGHELRTPITIVRGHLELLGDDPTERRETVALVTDELDRMSRFVDELLLLARAERPDFLRPETVDLAALSEELLAKARGLGRREWRLASTGAGMIRADRQRLTQAVVNLAENAVRHTGESATITLGTALNGGEVRIWVSDDGPGIPLAEQRRVFDRLTRGSDTRDGSGDGSGTGLGLAIVRAIAVAHGGRVELKSRPSAGSRFTIVIPSVAGEAAPT